MNVSLVCGDCLQAFPTMEPDSLDACVTDPPYGLAFMGARWDHNVPGAEYWRAILRILKPGAHLVAFGGTRTYHRMACAVEDAGCEIRDTLSWLYGSGFPKSMNVAKKIDARVGAAGALGDAKSVLRTRQQGNGKLPGWDSPSMHGDGVENYAREYLPGSDEGRIWKGWGTALKPACELIVLARKPLSETTVAANVLRWGTGALNIDGCRLEAEKRPQFDSRDTGCRPGYGGGLRGSARIGMQVLGRWPANVCHDGSDDVINGFPASNGQSPARFFYCGKASGSEREDGLSGPELPQGMDRRNLHPTVKPTALMQWLVRLVTPPGGTVLDPFMGTGSTGRACAREGFGFVGIELDAGYVEIARRRIAAAELQAQAQERKPPDLFGYDVQSAVPAA